MIVIVVVVVFGMGALPRSRRGTIATMPRKSTPHMTVPSASTRGGAQELTHNSEGPDALVERRERPTLHDITGSFITKGRGILLRQHHGTYTHGGGSRLSEARMDNHFVSQQKGTNALTHGSARA